MPETKCGIGLGAMLTTLNNKTKMANLLEETLYELDYHGKIPNDVKWCGNLTHKFTWNEFQKIAETANYDAGFGAPEVA